MKRTKRNNKGFSLVELIIVIAIMAILAGVLAPQFVKYIGRSRISTDIQNAQQIATAISAEFADTARTTAVAEQTITDGKAKWLAIQMLLVQQELRKRFLVEYQK